MGTRAQFFVGDPRDIDNRVYLGCIAFDGYPDGDCKAFAKCDTERKFRNAVKRLASKRRDFSDPAVRSFPFPWKDDLFLTDCTYAWFNDAVQFTWFHRGFVKLADYNSGSGKFLKAYYDGADELRSDVPAPSDSDKPAGVDSIMIISA